MANDGKLTGHSALIAGASSPIGLATAKLLAAEDCQLHLAGQNDQALDLGIAEIKELYEIDVEVHPTDLSEPVNVAVLALECEHVNILINSLGEPVKGSIDELEHEDWQNGFDLTLFSAINLTREVLESLYELGSGIIVNVGGMVDGDEDENLCIVSANAALQAFSEILDKKTKLEGIRVLTFLPQANISAEENAAVLNRIILGKLFS
jgi:short-subunit dehydrogenase